MLKNILEEIYYVFFSLEGCVYSDIEEDKGHVFSGGELEADAEPKHAFTISRLYDENAYTYEREFIKVEENFKAGWKKVPSVDPKTCLDLDYGIYDFTIQVGGGRERVEKISTGILFTSPELPTLTRADVAKRYNDALIARPPDSTTWKDNGTLYELDLRYNPNFNPTTLWGQQQSGGEDSNSNYPYLSKTGEKLAPHVLPPGIDVSVFPTRNWCIDAHTMKESIDAGRMSLTAEEYMKMKRNTIVIEDTLTFASLDWQQIYIDKIWQKCQALLPFNTEECSTTVELLETEFPDNAMLLKSRCDGIAELLSIWKTKWDSWGKDQFITDQSWKRAGFNTVKFDSRNFLKPNVFYRFIFQAGTYTPVLFTYSKKLTDLTFTHSFASGDVDRGHVYGEIWRAAREKHARWVLGRKFLREETTGADVHRYMEQPSEHDGDEIHWTSKNFDGYKTSIASYKQVPIPIPNGIINIKINGKRDIYMVRWNKIREKGPILLEDGTVDATLIFQSEHNQEPFAIGFQLNDGQNLVSDITVTFEVDTNTSFSKVLLAELEGEDVAKWVSSNTDEFRLTSKGETSGTLIFNATEYQLAGNNTYTTKIYAESDKGRISNTMTINVTVEPLPFAIRFQLNENQDLVLDNTVTFEVDENTLFSKALEAVLLQGEDVSTWDISSNTNKFQLDRNSEIYGTLTFWGVEFNPSGNNTYIAQIYAESNKGRISNTMTINVVVKEPLPFAIGFQLNENQDLVSDNTVTFEVDTNTSFSKVLLAELEGEDVAKWVSSNTDEFRLTSKGETSGTLIFNATEYQLAGNNTYTTKIYAESDKGRISNTMTINVTVEPLPFAIRFQLNENQDLVLDNTVTFEVDENTPLSKALWAELPQGEDVTEWVSSNTDKFSLISNGETYGTLIFNATEYQSAGNNTYTTEIYAVSDKERTSNTITINVTVKEPEPVGEPDIYSINGTTYKLRNLQPSSETLKNEIIEMQGAPNFDAFSNGLKIDDILTPDQQTFILSIIPQLSRVVIYMETTYKIYWKNYANTFTLKEWSDTNSFLQWAEMYSTTTEQSSSKQYYVLYNTALYFNITNDNSWTEIVGNNLKFDNTSLTYRGNLKLPNKTEVPDKKIYKQIEVAAGQTYTLKDFIVRREPANDTSDISGIKIFVYYREYKTRYGGPEKIHEEEQEISIGGRFGGFTFTESGKDPTEKDEWGNGYTGQKWYHLGLKISDEGGYLGTETWNATDHKRTFILENQNDFFKYE